MPDDYVLPGRFAGKTEIVTAPPAAADVRDAPQRLGVASGMVAIDRVWCEDALGFDVSVVAVMGEGIRRTCREFR